MADDIASQLEGAVESLGRFRDSLEDSNIRMGNASSIEAKINKLEVDKLNLLQKANKAEGKRLKDLGKGMGAAVKGMGALAKKLGIVGGILTAFQGFVNVVLKANKHAALMSKLMGDTRQATDGLRKQATNVASEFYAMGMTLADSVKSAAALAQEFGQASRVSDQMIKQVGQMNKAFGVSVQEGANFEESLERARVNSQEILDSIIKTGTVAGGNLGVAMRDVVKNSQMIPLYTQRGLDNFTSMVTTATTLGTSIDKIAAVGESFIDVNDVAENINQTAQVLGQGFADALPSVMKMVEMSNNFQDVELMDAVAKAAAGQLEVTDKGLQITRIELQRLSKHFGGDQELARRAVMNAAYREELIEKSIYNQQQIEDMSAAELEARNDITRNILKEHKIKGDLITLSRKTEQVTAKTKMSEDQITAEIEKRYQKRIASEKTMEDIIADSMTVMQKLEKLMNQIIAPLEDAISEVFNEAFIKDMEDSLKVVGETLKNIFTIDTNAIGRQMEEDAKKTGGSGFGAGLQAIADQISTRFAAAFNITNDGKVITSFGGLMDYGAAKFIAYMEDKTEVLGNIFAKIMRSAWKQIVGPGGIGTGGMELPEMPEASPAKPPDKEGYNTIQVGNQWIQVPKTDISEGVTVTAPEGGFKAKGWAGGAHRAIVGEAGAEVGITRNALRELASAGIPGYANGGNFVADLITNRGGLTQATGSGVARDQRQQAADAAGEAYRNRIRTHEQDFLNIPRDIHDVWGRSAKEFFITYPAVVDEAIGTAFRQAGPVAEGLYNSVFSGFQAYSRAELSGASPAAARRLMYQHMAAEGLKKNGIIDQSLKKMTAMQADLLKEGRKQNILTQGGNALLGGIKGGLAAAAGVIAAGGSREQAQEMAKRGLIGGIIKDVTGQFGQADEGFLSTMNVLGMLTGSTPMPPYAGKDAGAMIATALSRTEQTFQAQGRGLGWGGANAQGRVYNSPHLAMVGEGSQNEIIVPTERIRKGLPINAGVARELASIGVPGYFTGGFFSSDPNANKWGSTQGMVGFGGKYAGGSDWAGSRGGAAIHNVKTGAGTSLATAGLSFAQSYMQHGDAGLATGQALGAGLGMAASAALTPFLGPFAPLAGGLIGSFVGNKLGGMLAYKPDYKGARSRAIKNLEQHVMTKGKFMHGAPPGISSQITQAIAGKGGKYPSEKAMKNLVSEVSNNPVLAYGFGPDTPATLLLSLLSGNLDNTAEETQAYAKFNRAFYGATPMAKGGIVTKPTNAIVGEAGPEAVIPLDQHSGYASRQQMQDQKDIIGELRKQNQQMGMFIKNMGDAKTVLQVDGRQLAETVGQNMYDINTGM